MEDAHYRPLLPAQASQPEPRQTASIASLPKKRRRQPSTKVACNACRARKSACDGARPTCQACEARALQCIYISKDSQETPVMALKRKYNSERNKSMATEELVNNLRYLPDDLAQDLFLKLRNTTDITSILQVDNPTKQITATGVLPQIVPENELELHLRHSIAYPLFDLKVDKPFSQELEMLSMPMDWDKSDQPEASSRSSFDHAVTSASTDAPMSTIDSNILLELPDTSHYETKFPANDGSELLKYFEDTRLDGLNIRFWTTVDISNELAAGAISLYLETNHHIMGAFDSRLFVYDLINCRPRFCSSFLVNSLLAFALQAFGLKNSEACTKSYELESEAENHWRLNLQRSGDSITTISGLMLLYHSIACHGRTDLGMVYIEAMIPMAHRLRLFGGRSPLTSRDLEFDSRDEQVAIAQTAWGSFILAVTLAKFHLLTVIESPPLLPIPGNAEDREMSYTGTDEAKPSTFPTFCKFWTIISETLITYRQSDKAADITLSFALKMYSKLLKLADNLSKSMFRVEGGPSHVLVFHVWYHAACLDLFRPFLLDEEQVGSHSWVPSAMSTRAIFAASLKQLKLLMFEIIHKHKEATHNFMWHIALMYIANATINDSVSSESRFYFFFCIRGYQQLHASYAFIEGIILGLLAMALNKNLINAEEAGIFAQELQTYGGHRKLGERITGGYILDLDLAITDSEAAKVDNLIDQFEQIAVLDDFTNDIS